MKNSIIIKLAYFIIMVIAISFSTSQNAFAQKKSRAKDEKVTNQKVKEDYGNTVTLVTSGTGKTKDDAIKNALRNALEQTYGTFVSANTQVVNDELIKDEIVSIASGNVQGYNEISSSETEDGFDVSLRVVVSIGKLVSFAENHGMNTELAGNTFMQNINLAKLNQENEISALNNLMEQLQTIKEKGLFDFEIKVSQPQKEYDDVFTVEAEVMAIPNKNYEAFWDVIDKTLSSLSMSPAENENYKTMGLKSYLYYYYPSDLKVRHRRLRKERVSPYDGAKPYILRNDLGDNRMTYGTSKDILDYIMISARSFEVFDNIETLITPILVRKDPRRYYKDEDTQVNIAGDMYIIQVKKTKDVHWFHSGLSDGSDQVASFTINYTGDKLSQLRNISIRPHKITEQK